MHLFKMRNAPPDDVIFIYCINQRIILQTTFIRARIWLVLSFAIPFRARYCASLTTPLLISRGTLLRFYTNGAKWSGENSSPWQQLRVIEFRICNARLYFSSAVKNPCLVDETKRVERSYLLFFIVCCSWKNSVITLSQKYIHSLKYSLKV